MTYVGTIYILWLALKIYRSKPTNNNTEDDGNNNFLSGLILQFVNVKVILYGLTTVSTFIIPFYQSVIALFSFSILLAFVGFMATNCWSLFGLGFQRILISHFKLLNIVMTLLLVYTAASLHF